MRFLSFCLKFVLIVVFSLSLLAKVSYAKIRFTLQAPTGQLTRGQTVTFLVNIDTQGASLSSTAIAADYKTQYLQFQQATPGNTFTVIKTSSPSDGRVLIEGTTDPAFSGQGIFAYLNFKLIAEAPGGTELCVLSNPSPTTLPSPTPQPTQAVAPTTVVPTRLPQTGSVQTGNRAIILGGLFIVTALVVLTIKKLRHFHKND